MTSPGPANSLLSRASFANGDQRLYARDSTYLLYSPDYREFGSPHIRSPPETPFPDPNERRLERDWDVETVRDFDGERNDRGSNDLSDPRDGYVRSLQEENQRLEAEMRRKVEEGKKREEEMRRKDEEVRKAYQELEKMQESAKRMAEKERKDEQAKKAQQELQKRQEEAKRKEIETKEEAGRKEQEEIRRKEKDDAETTRLKQEALRAKEQEIEERERALKVREEELERREDETKRSGQDLRKKEEETSRNEEQKKRREAATLTEDVEKTRRVQKEANHQPEVVQKGISPAQEIIERFNRQRVVAEESAVIEPEHRRNQPIFVIPPDNYIPILDADTTIIPPPPHELLPPAVVRPRSSSPIPQRDRRIEVDEPAVRERERHGRRRNWPNEAVVLPKDNYIPILYADTKIPLPPPHQYVQPAVAWPQPSSATPYLDRRVEAEEFAAIERDLSLKSAIDTGFVPPDPFLNADTKITLPPPHELAPRAVRPRSLSVIPHWDRQVEAKEFAIIERERSQKYGELKQIYPEKSTKSKPLPNTKSRRSRPRSPHPFPDDYIPHPNDTATVIPEWVPQPPKGVWPLLSTSSDGDQRVGYPPINHNREHTHRLKRVSDWVQMTAQHVKEYQHPF